MSLPGLPKALETLYGCSIRSFQITKKFGDASSRRYFRVRVTEPPVKAPKSVCVMQLPDDAFQSDEGGTPIANTQLPFVEVAELLAQRGLPVPSIYVEDLPHGILLLEDLGDLTLAQQLRRTPRHDWRPIYERAVDLLANLHERCASVPATSVVSQRRFDRTLLKWELEHFQQWGLEATWGPLDIQQHAVLSQTFAELVDQIEVMPYGFVHRDYQSRNIMVVADGDLHIIDFQDALIGPRVYDLVALLCDSYVPLDLELQESMVVRYAKTRRIEPTKLLHEFWTVAIHRKLKDAGRFVFIDRVRHNPDFLCWYPQSLLYVGRAVQSLGGFDALSRVFQQKIPGFADKVPTPDPFHK